MALIKCNECGSKISDQASVCPTCGCPIIPVTYCTSCGEKVSDGNFCTNCGKSNIVKNNNNNMCGLALAGGITGIGSLILDPIGLAAITAIVLSSIGLNKVKVEGKKGKGWAITGLVCGIVEAVFKFFIIMAYFD